LRVNVWGKITITVNKVACGVGLMTVKMYRALGYIINCWDFISWVSSVAETVHHVSRSSFVIPGGFITLGVILHWGMFLTGGNIVRFIGGSPSSGRRVGQSGSKATPYPIEAMNVFIVSNGRERPSQNKDTTLPLTPTNSFRTIRSCHIQFKNASKSLVTRYESILVSSNSSDSKQKSSLLLRL
jgi:hypothetical protein